MCHILRNSYTKKQHAHLLTLVLIVFVPPVWGETLMVADAAPRWMHWGAWSILALHIAGGAVGIVSGLIASGARKGRKLHRISGTLFFRAMFISYVIAAVVSPLMTTGQRPNFVAGVLALYLLLSGVSAARRRNFTASYVERLGLFAALFVTGMGVWFAAIGLHSASGTVDGSPPQAFLIFVLFGAIAIYGELRVLVKKKLSEVERQRRHLWRMCASFFIASGSLFLGQSQLFPNWFNESILPSLLAFTPLMVMIYFIAPLNLLLRRSNK